MYGAQPKNKTDLDYLYWFSHKTARAHPRNIPAWSEGDDLKHCDSDQKLKNALDL